MANGYILQLFEDFLESRGYRFSQASREAFASVFQNIEVLANISLDERLRLFKMVVDELDRQYGDESRPVILHEPDVPRAAQQVSGRLTQTRFAGFSPAAQKTIRDSCPWC